MNYQLLSLSFCTHTRICNNQSGENVGKRKMQKNTAI